MITFAVLTGSVTSGTVRRANTGSLNIPVTDGTRLLMVVSITALDLLPITSTTLHFSDGVHMVTTLP